MYMAVSLLDTWCNMNVDYDQEMTDVDVEDLTLR
jgi:hypothetical protein